MNPKATTATHAMKLALISEDGGLLHLHCAGEIIVPDFDPQHDPLLPWLGSAGYTRKVVLNLELATLLDTSGVSWLVNAHRSFAAAGGVLILHSVPPRVSAILKLLRLDKALNVANDFNAARALAQKGNS